MLAVSSATVCVLGRSTCLEGNRSVDGSRPRRFLPSPYCVRPAGKDTRRALSPRCAEPPFAWQLRRKVEVERHHCKSLDAANKLHARDGDSVVLYIYLGFSLVERSRLLFRRTQTPLCFNLDATSVETQHYTMTGVA